MLQNGHSLRVRRHPRPPSILQTTWLNTLRVLEKILRNPPFEVLRLCRREMQSSMACIQQQPP